MSLLNSLIPSFSLPLARREPRSDGEVGVKPPYRIRETKDAYGVTVHMAGVSKEGLELTADNGQLRIVGRRAWKQPEGWTALHRESPDAPYELVLTHDNAINIDQVHAELADGVLRVSLPKSEALKPRRIAVN